MNNFITLNDPKHVDLGKHGVIEASAGTGKTHTLIELVMRALMEHRLTIDKILLVTFTEQATGELKSRIRARILTELEEVGLSVDLAEHLKKALQQLSQASVFTIHGFCHRTLKEFAFEQRSVFESDIVDDNELRSQLLHQMKRAWTGDSAMVAQIQAFTGESSISKIDDLLLELAKQYKPESDVFYPSDAQAFVANITAQLKALEKIELSTLLQEFNAIQGLAKNPKEKYWDEIIAPFLTQLLAVVGKSDLAEVRQFLVDFYKNQKQILPKFFPRKPAVYVVDRADSRALQNQQNSPKIFALAAALDHLCDSLNHYEEAQKIGFIPDLLQQLNQQVRQHKLNKGLISYDDMIMRLWEELSAEVNLPEQHLTHAIRAKYRLALIDEFQDTDPKQWQIFKQLFLCEGHQLFVIGDPKQAIYSFRGADVNTYRKAVEEICSSHGGLAYRLSHNYRTSKPLVNALNQFFARESNDSKQNGWFNASEVTVEVPKENPHYSPPSLVENPHSIAAVSQILVSGEKADVLKQNLAKQIAETIKFQLLNQVQISFKNQTKYIGPSDVCVLVRSRNEAEFVEEALLTLSIPFSYHKKQDLYQSIEAIHFQILLTALAQPNRKERFNNLLISLFFDIKPKELASYSEINKDINNIWTKAKLACNNKDWVKVFDIMLHDTGALFRHRHNNRRLANIKQLQQQLLDEALQSNCEAKSLLKRFRYWREKNTSEEALHHKDTEQSAVKIMTMHISKGLEFPVVFLMGGLTASTKQPKFLKFYDPAQQKTVFDLVKVHQKTYDQQQIEEYQQLFYVAMTRAIFMLFLPNVVHDEVKKLNGPYAQTAMPRINQLNIPVHVVSKAQKITATQDNRQSATSLPSLPVLNQNSSINLYSFSSLSRIKSHRHNTESEFVVSDMSESIMAEELTQDDPVENSVAQVPGGVKTGLALHGIFENVSFKDVCLHTSTKSLYYDDTIMDVIDEQMHIFRLENRPLFNQQGDEVTAIRLELASWVWHTLKKPLEALGGYSLGSVAQENRRHELSFFWHQSNTNLTGFIDLLFAIEGKEFTDYYILDWKSNLSLNGYSPQVLADEVMKKHDYKWQYELYALAMQRWFDSLGLKKARLKGALYVFSRGMDCHEQVQNGVFYDDFTRKNWNIDAIEADLLAFTETGDVA